jgi:translation initiation factor 1 (eIF-1/SUI1)
MGIRIPCLRCGKFEPECACPPLPKEPEEPVAAPPPAPVAAPKMRAEVVKMRREKRGGGREMIVLEGFPRDVKLEELARDLKKMLG